MTGICRSRARRNDSADHNTGTLKATEAWTNGRHAEDDKYVELDCELAVALATVTEGAARSTVVKVTQVEPCHRFVAWQAPVNGHALKSLNDPTAALRPILAAPKRCKDAQELKEKLTKVAEYEHQFKVIDEALKMMPKIKRVFLTGPWKFGKILEKLEIIINERVADNRPVPMGLGNVGTHDARTTQSDQDASNHMSYDDVCVSDRVERIQSWQRSRQQRTKRNRNAVPRKRS